MTIEKSSFLKLGAPVFFGTIASRLSIDIAENYSIIEKNSKLFSSLPSFEVGFSGMVIGTVITMFIQEYLSKKDSEKKLKSIIKSKM